MLQLWHRLNALDGSCKPAEEVVDVESDLIKHYLDSYFEKDSHFPENEVVPSENGKIFQLLKELELRPKVPILAPTYVNPSSEPSTSSSQGGIPTSKKEPFDILRYWMAERVRNPQMFRLATVVYSAPSTQVSVERAFSALKLILTDHRQRLSDEHIQEIMMLKINPEMLPDVAKKLDEDMDRYAMEADI